MYRLYSSLFVESESQSLNFHFRLLYVARSVRARPDRPTDRFCLREARMEINERGAHAQGHALRSAGDEDIANIITVNFAYDAPKF